MLSFHEAELLFTAHPDAAHPDAAHPDAADPYTADPYPPDAYEADPAVTGRGGYTARVLVPGPLLADGIGPEVFTGRWIVRDGLLATAIAVPAKDAP